MHAAHGRRPGPGNRRRRPQNLDGKTRRRRLALAVDGGRRRAPRLQVDGAKEEVRREGEEDVTGKGVDGERWGVSIFKHKRTHFVNC